ncbi:MAG: tetratricopeptide repeat protein [Candidatus Riflebacteria bacterium]|nr:tetratricopeptide repeat protein [Candidatus Riflebacteria bacterium]
MEEALKERAGGRRDKAISLLKQAVDEASKSDQKNLACLLLGDFLLEADRAKDALPVFEQVISSKTDSESLAEATFRMAQAYYKLGLNEKARKYARNLISSYPDSDYSQLAGNLLQTIRSSAGNFRNENVFSEPLPAESLPEKSLPEKPLPEKPLSAETRQAELMSAVTSKSAVDPILIYPGSVKKNDEKTINRILYLQKYLKENPSSLRADELLLELADKTAKFGEHLEACRLFDRILNEHQSSKNIERAFFEAVRLRAILGAYPAVISWGKSFIDNFENSKNRADMKKLIVIAEKKLAEKGKPGLSGNSENSEKSEKMIEPGKADKSEKSEKTEKSDKSDKSNKAAKSENVNKTENAGNIRKSETIERVSRFENAGNISKSEKIEKIEKIERIATSERTERADIAGIADRTGTRDKSGKSGVASDSPDKLLREKKLAGVKRLVRAGSYSKALTDLESISAEFPDDPEILMELALVQIQKKDYSSASGNLDKLLELQPDNSQARSMLGYLHYQSKDYEKAAAEYGRIENTEKNGLAFFDPEYAAKKLGKTAKNEKRVNAKKEK